jgi:hypothetical protein
MKRRHVYASVTDLAESVRFYSIRFGAAPAMVEADDAK